MPRVLLHQGLQVFACDGSDVLGQELEEGMLPGAPGKLARVLGVELLDPEEGSGSGNMADVGVDVLHDRVTSRHDHLEAGADAAEELHQHQAL